MAIRRRNTNWRVLRCAYRRRPPETETPRQSATVSTLSTNPGVELSAKKQAQERTPRIFHPESPQHELTVECQWVSRKKFEYQQYPMLLYYIIIMINVSQSHCELIEWADCPHI